MVTSLHSKFLHKESNLEVAAMEQWGIKGLKYRFPIGKLATRRKELQEICLENCQSLQEEKRKVDHVSKRVSGVLESATISTVFSRL